MQKAIFFDWDDTLSADGETISIENREALQQVQKMGHLTFLCTSRAYGWLAEESKKLHFDGIICGLGSHILIGDNVIFRKRIPEHLLKNIVAHLLVDGQPCILEGEKHIFLLNHDTTVTSPWIHIQSLQDFDRLVAGQPITKLLLKKRMLSETTKELLSPHFSIRIYKTMQEIALPGCTKASGIEKVLNYFGIPVADSIAMGDNLNDIEMLQYAGMGIGIGNVPQEVREIADAVEISVAEGLKKWVLSEKTKV